jgi:hypothetical protein
LTQRNSSPSAQPTRRSCWAFRSGIYGRFIPAGDYRGPFGSVVVSGGTEPSWSLGSTPAARPAIGGKRRRGPGDDRLDAVIGVAALAAVAFKVAASDITDYGAEHAFRRADGAIARLGDAGTIELLPHSTVKPPCGWALALPCAGAFAAHGGGVIVDPFEDKPIQHEHVPRCNAEAWAQFIAEARAALSRRATAAVPQRTRPRASYTDSSRDLLDRVDHRTSAFLDGITPEGQRNAAAFAASANLIGCGVEEHEAERLIMAGAAACGLPEREARAAFASAVSVMARKRRHR